MRLRRSAQEPPEPVPAGGQSITATIGGTVTNSQVAVGNDNVQTQTIAAAPVTDAELAELHQLFDALKAQIVAEAPPERRAAALERVEELEQATLADEPDLTTMQYVGKWFGSNVPKLAGAVAGVVVHPIVGKLVGAAGDALVAEFRKL
jgi:hypothetical protein